MKRLLVVTLLFPHATFSTLPPALVHVRSGKLRALALTGSRRSAALPDIPTIAESGVPGYEALGWWGILAPTRTPRPIIATLNSHLVKVLAGESARAQLFREGIEAAGSTPEQYGARIASERQKWSKVIKEANIRIE